ncbi:conjugal transfer protein TraX [Chryseobacterium antibioticum]|uniref:Conjugal transfer protein TraX n=1 Tax=Chryseobacterium pyrolae TaxID=2987481 RepID=A0ABT2IMV3_9FLAO|nr:conjugal transfer protein TraX [Chryseobacterium pyrolae]MCT2410007.1 conjugal transfer protein TraX [Chryseobacterium pyrolae]
MLSQFQILNSYHLKILALTTMILDHVGAMFFPDFLPLRIIGRVAFILYAFMLVEGVNNTRNIKNYIQKIFIWALISEIPFDLAFYGKPFYFEHQNIFFTLLISILGLQFFQKSKSFFLSFIVGLVCLVVSYFFKFDYSWYGTSLIFAFYLFRKLNFFKFIFIETISTIATFNVLGVQFFAFLGFIPIFLYNGKQGKKIGKIYYSFYAIHLLIFALIKYVTNV